MSLFQGAGLAPTPSGRSAILSSSPTLTAFCAPSALGEGRLRLRVHDSGKDGQLANLLDVAAPTPTSIFSTRPVAMEETVTTEATARSLQLQLQQEHFVLSGEIQKAMPQVNSRVDDIEAGDAVDQAWGETLTKLRDVVRELQIDIDTEDAFCSWSA